MVQPALILTFAAAGEEPLSAVFATWLAIERSRET